MKKIMGFTLIELMVVIAIVGILVSMAVPAYENYVKRARITSGLELASTAKIAVEESIAASYGVPEGNIATSYKGPAPTENVSSITIDSRSGDITITYTPAAGNGTIILVPAVQPTGEVQWDCKEGTLPTRYRPKTCQ